MRKSPIISLYMAGAASMLLPILVLGQTATSVETEPQQAQILEQARNFLGDVNTVAEQTQQTRTQIEQVVEKSGWKETFGKVWQGIKEFFSDKNARDLLVDTVKLFFRLLANVFLLIGGVIQKVLQTFGS